MARSIVDYLLYGSFPCYSIPEFNVLPSKESIVGGLALNTARLERGFESGLDWAS
jgi:hypothetical protein